jgi:hypothetical protein
MVAHLLTHRPCGGTIIGENDMSMYYCYTCDRLLDDDHHPCESHPKDDRELICPDCLAEYNEKAQEAAHEPG